MSKGEASFRVLATYSRAETQTRRMLAEEFKAWSIANTSKIDVQFADGAVVVIFLSVFHIYGSFFNLYFESMLCSLVSEGVPVCTTSIEKYPFDSIRGLSQV